MQKKLSKDKCVALFQHANIELKTQRHLEVRGGGGVPPRCSSRSRPEEVPHAVTEVVGGRRGGGGLWDTRVNLSANPSLYSLAPTGLCTVGVIVHAPHRKRVCVYMCVKWTGVLCACTKKRVGYWKVTALDFDKSFVTCFFCFAPSCRSCCCETTVLVRPKDHPKQALKGIVTVVCGWQNKYQQHLLVSLAAVFSTH